MKQLAITHPHPKLFICTSKNITDNNRAFLRLQEFSESPFPEIRGKYFTVAQYKPLYVKYYGQWSYYEDWAGFNIYSHEIRAFYDLFPENRLSKFEKNLKAYLKSQRVWDEEYCITAIQEHDDKTLAHELSHAFYYFDKSYKRSIERLMHRVPFAKRSAYERILAVDYASERLLDEMCAYYSTEDIEMLVDYLGEKDPRNIDWNVAYDMQKLNAAYRDKYEI